MVYHIYLCTHNNIYCFIMLYIGECCPRCFPVKQEQCLRCDLVPANSPAFTDGTTIFICNEDGGTQTEITGPATLSFGSVPLLQVAAQFCSDIECQDESAATCPAGTTVRELRLGTCCSDCTDGMSSILNIYIKIIIVNNIHM